MQKHSKLIKCVGVSRSYLTFSSSWAPCNTYWLQPYTALFVFIFMAATLQSSFLKGFYYYLFPSLFKKIITLSLFLFACTYFSVLKNWDFNITIILV